jgi:hypothetical protein
MDWWGWVLLGLVGGFFLWRHSKNQEKAVVATKRLAKDNQLYQHIKAGMREFEWQKLHREFRRFEDRAVIFENAHMKAFKVGHVPEFRVGFYFKDLNEYGLYGFFAGNGDETFESYYRTDSTFTKEEMLLHNDL